MRRNELFSALIAGLSDSDIAAKCSGTMPGGAAVTVTEADVIAWKDATRPDAVIPKWALACLAANVLNRAVGIAELFDLCDTVLGKETQVA